MAFLQNPTDKRPDTQEPGDHTGHTVHTSSLIIGGGPAGYTAALYLARYGRKPVLVQGPLPGGQLTMTTEVENFPGFSKPVQGPWLMDQMRDQAVHCGAALMHDTVERIDVSCRPFVAYGQAGRYTAQTLILATGASTLWLGLASEERFRGFGVSSCATCDGRFFRGKDVVVVGGGNTAVEEALFLAQHVAHVTLVHRRDQLRADQILQERLWAQSNVSVLWNHTVQEVLGEESGHHKHVTGLAVAHTHTGAIQKLDVQGVFVAIGHTPNTNLVQGILPMDAFGYVSTHPGSCKTDIPGIFAAGDVQDRHYRQAVTAAGQGCMAAMDAERYLQEHHTCSAPAGT